MDGGCCRVVDIWVAKRIDRISDPIKRLSPQVWPHEHASLVIRLDVVSVQQLLKVRGGSPLVDSIDLNGRSDIHETNLEGCLTG